MACVYGSNTRARVVLFLRKEAAVTRESKLALIIGFVLVLVVGVLVSDHFSQASTMTLDTQEPGVLSSTGPITDLGQREKQGLNNAIDQATRGPATNPNPGYAAVPQAPVEIQNGRPSSDDALAFNAPTTNNNSLIDRALHEARKQMQETELPKAAEYTLTPKQDPPAPIAIPTRLPQIKYDSYTVVSGDTLIGIARRLLGDGERWPQLHELNADILGPDAILQIGMTLKVPSNGNSNTSFLTATSGSTSSSTSKPTKSSNASASTTTYTVVAGDTLGEISMKFLGTSKRIDEIVKLNKLGSADDIRIGMKLKIPSK